MNVSWNEEMKGSEKKKKHSQTSWSELQIPPSEALKSDLLTLCGGMWTDTSLMRPHRGIRGKKVGKGDGGVCGGGGGAQAK